MSKLGPWGASKGTHGESFALRNHKGNHHMKTIFKSAMLASFAAATLGLAACDGPAENASEDAGEANAEAVNAAAEASEDAGAMTDAQADAVTDQAEDAADAAEETGEAVDNANGQ